MVRELTEARNSGIGVDVRMRELRAGVLMREKMLNAASNYVAVGAPFSYLYVDLSKDKQGIRVEYAIKEAFIVSIYEEAKKYIESRGFRLSKVTRLPGGPGELRVFFHMDKYGFDECKLGLHKELRSGILKGWFKGVSTGYQTVPGAGVITYKCLVLRKMMNEPDVVKALDAGGYDFVAREGIYHIGEIVGLFSDSGKGYTDADFVRDEELPEDDFFSGMERYKNRSKPTTRVDF